MKRRQGFAFPKFVRRTEQYLLTDTRRSRAVIAKIFRFKRRGNFATNHRSSFHAA
jgi:hypothetical protein